MKIKMAIPSVVMAAAVCVALGAFAQ